MTGYPGGFLVDTLQDSPWNSSTRFMAGSCVASRRYKGPLHWASKNCVKYLILHVGKTPVFQIQMDLVRRSMMIYDMKVLWYISMGELCRNARLQGSSHKVCVSFCPFPHVVFDHAWKAAWSLTAGAYPNLRCGKLRCCWQLLTCGPFMALIRIMIMCIYINIHICVFFLLRPFGTMQVAASKAWIHLYWASVTSLLYVCDDGWSLGRSAPQILLHAWSGIWPETLHQSQFPFGKEPAIGDGQSFPQAHG